MFVMFLYTVSTESCFKGKAHRQNISCFFLFHRTLSEQNYPIASCASWPKNLASLYKRMFFASFNSSLPSDIGTVPTVCSLE